jgi:NAD(P)-dependent dehydrogenase (short-subunit alcohol dehydrogenase family)
VQTRIGEETMFELNGRVALVTGAGTGLGQAIACGLAEAGARVVITARTSEKAKDTAEKVQQRGHEAVVFQLDVTRRSDIERVFQQVATQWGSLDILVNSAGIAKKGTALEYLESDWDQIIDTNLKGTFLCSQIAARLMVEQKRGKIINIASIGSLIAYPGSIAYLASKGGVAQLTKGFAVELAPFNIQVNAIAPSLFDTPMVTKSRPDPKAREYFMTRTPIGRLGQPEEVVGATIFLASDASTMVTGHILAVDGGFLAS